MADRVREGGEGDPDSAVLDFVGRFLDDESRGILRPLDDYLARYPENQAGIERAYLELVAGRGSNDDGRSSRPTDSSERLQGTVERVGPYRLIRKLGAGGQGLVYLAVDVRLRRRVALKLLHPTYVTSSSARRRFRREAEVISRLEEPGLCTILDADFEGETPYIAMRYVEGSTLAHLLKGSRAGDETVPDWVRPRTREGVERSLALFEGLARAVHAAHEANVVHRDVKPGNILWDVAGRLVLVDFGLARDLELDARTLTRQSVVLGTPQYMSPEQLDSGVLVDRRTDVYSLAAVAFEALTLERPFQGVGLMEQRRLVLENEIPRVSALNDALPRDLDALFERALERNLDRRYSTALELAEELGRARAGEALHARPASVTYRARKFVARHRVLVAVTTLLLLALSLSTATVLWSRGEVQASARRETVAARHLRLASAMESVLDGDEPNARAKLAEAGPVASGWVGRVVENLLERHVQEWSIGSASFTRMKYSSDFEWMFAWTQTGPEDAELELLNLCDGRRRTKRVARHVSSAEFCEASEAVVLATRQGWQVLDLPTLAVRRDGEEAVSYDGLTVVGREFLIAVAGIDLVRRFSVDSGELVDEFSCGVLESGLGSFGPEPTVTGWTNMECWVRRGGSVRRWPLDTDQRWYNATGLALRGLPGQPTTAYGIPDEGLDELERLGRFASDVSLEALPSGVHCWDFLPSSSLRLFDALDGTVLDRFLARSAKTLERSFVGREDVCLCDTGGRIRRFDLTLGPAVPLARSGEVVGATSGAGHVMVRIRGKSHVVWALPELRESRLPTVPLRDHLSITMDASGSRFALVGKSRRSTESGTGEEVWGVAVRPGPSKERAWGVVPVEAGTRDVALSADGSRLLAVSPEKLWVFDVTEPGFGRVVADRVRVRGATAGASAPVIAAADGCWFLHESEGLARYGPALEDRTSLLAEGPGRVPILAADDRGERLVVSNERGEVVVVRAADGHVLARIPDAGTAVQDACLHPEESLVVVARGNALSGWSFGEEGLPPQEQLRASLEVGLVIDLSFQDGGDDLLVVGRRGLALLQAESDPPALRRERERLRRARSLAQWLLREKGTELAPLRVHVHECLPAARVDRDEAEAMLDAYRSPIDANRRAWDAVTNTTDLANLEPFLRTQREVVAELPWSEHAWNTLATLEVRLGRYEEALRSLDRADELDAEDPSNLVMAAAVPAGNLLLRTVALAGLGRMEEARDVFLRATELSDPRAFHNSVLLGWAEAALGAGGAVHVPR